MKSIEEKCFALTSILSEAGSAIVAFSGGTDSMFLINEASKIKGLRLLAVTIRTPYMFSNEISEAESFCNERLINHRIIDMEIPLSIKNNPAERCYLCKTEILRIISNIAVSEGYSNIFDGTNFDDLSDYRPGMRALKEFGIRSPLLEACLNKKEIRKLSRNEGLKTWDKPANACLLTRFPHDTLITIRDLGMAEEAEEFIATTGLKGSRVRVHGDIARIECRNEQFETLMSVQTRELIIRKLKSLGFRYITIDLEGYITGRMNKKT